LLCSIESSTVKKAGNLHLHNKDRLTYKKYDITTKRWKPVTKKSITEYERAILMLTGQGKSTKEIAGYLYKGHNTIRNQEKELFSKLNVHSKQEAIEYARCHCAMYPGQYMGLQPTEKPRKKKRIPPSEDLLQRIQQHLDDDKSIRQAAKLENIAESNIRRWISKYRLKK
jgi:DNA-binding CsgD family transcriptional regulator